MNGASISTHQVMKGMSALVSTTGMRVADTMIISQLSITMTKCPNVDSVSEVSWSLGFTVSGP